MSWKSIPFLLLCLGGVLLIVLAVRKRRMLRRMARQAAEDILNATSDRRYRTLGKDGAGMTFSIDVEGENKPTNVLVIVFSSAHTFALADPLMLRFWDSIGFIELNGHDIRSLAQEKHARILVDPTTRYELRIDLPTTPTRAV